MFTLMQVSAKGLVNLSIDQTGVTEKFTNLKLDEKKGPKRQVLITEVGAQVCTVYFLGWEVHLLL